MNSNEAFEMLHENVINRVESCMYEIPKKEIQKNPWISKECIKMGRNLIRLKKKFIKINTPYNEFCYKKAKREYQKVIRREKNYYYKNKLENCRGDSLKTWQIINELLNRSKKTASGANDAIKSNSKILTSEKEISEYMNNYYKNIAKEIELKIKKSRFTYHHYLEKSMQPEEAFSLVETYEN